MILSLLFIFHFLICIAAGLSLYKYTDSKKLFLIGIGLTPTLLAFFNFVQTLFSIQSKLYWPILFLLLNIYLWRNRAALLDLVSEFKDLILKSIKSVPIIFITSICVLIFTGLASYKYLKVPIYQHDGLAYGADSKEIVKGNINPNFSNDIEEFQTNHPHSPVYAHYLASGLRIYEIVGAKIDLGLRFNILIIHFYIVFLFMGIFSILGFNPIFGITGYGVLYLFNKSSQFIPHSLISHSRDPFRILSILIPTGILIWLIQNRVHRKKELWLIFILTFVAVSGHTLNILFMGVLFLVYLITLYINEKSYQKILTNGCFFIFVGIISSWNYIYNLIQHKNPLGFGFTYYSYKDSILWEILQEQMVQKVAHYTFEKKLSLLFFEGFGLFNLLLIALLISPFFFRSQLKLKFLSLFLLILLIPYTGLLDFGKVNLSTMFLKNYRYRFHWHILYTLYISLLMFNFKRFKVTRHILIAVLVFSSMYHFYGYRVRKVKNHNFFTDVLSNQYKNTCTKTLIDHPGWQYYNQNSKVLFVYSKPGAKILNAESPSLMLEKIKEYKIDCILLSTDKNWWDRHGIGQILSHGEKLELPSTKKFNLVRIQ